MNSEEHGGGPVQKESEENIVHVLLHIMNFTILLNFAYFRLFKYMRAAAEIILKSKFRAR